MVPKQATMYTKPMAAHSGRHKTHPSPQVLREMREGGGVWPAAFLCKMCQIPEKGQHPKIGAKTEKTTKVRRGLM